jgi:hypothetical protein
VNVFIANAGIFAVFFGVHVFEIGNYHVRKRIDLVEYV